MLNSIMECIFIFINIVIINIISKFIFYSLTIINFISKCEILSYKSHINIKYILKIIYLNYLRVKNET